MAIGYLTLKFMGNCMLMLVFVGALVLLVNCLHSDIAAEDWLSNSYLHIPVSGLAILLISLLMYRLESVECVRRYLSGWFADVNRARDLQQYEPITDKLRALHTANLLQSNTANLKQPNTNNFHRHSEETLDNFHEMWKRREQHPRQRYLSRGTHSSWEVDRMSNNLECFSNRHRDSRAPTNYPGGTGSDQSIKVIASLNRLYLSYVKENILTDGEGLDEEALDWAEAEIRGVRSSIGTLLHKVISNSLLNLQELQNWVQHNFHVHLQHHNEQDRFKSDRLGNGLNEWGSLSCCSNTAVSLAQLVEKYRANRSTQLPVKSTRLEQQSVHQLIEQRIRYDQLLNYSLSFNQESERMRTHQILKALALALINEQNLEEVANSCRHVPHFEGPFELQQYIIWLMVTKINRVTCRQGLLYVDSVPASQQGEGYFHMLMNRDCDYLHYDLIYMSGRGPVHKMHTKTGPDNVYSLFWMYFHRVDQMNRSVGAGTGYQTVFDRVMHSEDHFKRVQL